MLSISHFTPIAPFQRTSKRSNIRQRHREDRGQASRDLVRNCILCSRRWREAGFVGRCSCDRKADDRRMGEFLTKASRPKDEGEELKADAEITS